MDPNSHHNKAFGRTLRILRKSKGLTQETLAFEAELDRTYVSLLELGLRSPTLDTMMALCRALSTPVPTLATLIDAELRLGVVHG